ncbi:chloride channel protein [Candidatus Saccharibacteria bacterium]|nr:chloride channel protein [Candidatus Saccharibacteria bacterium]
MSGARSIGMKFSYASLISYSLALGLFAGLVTTGFVFIIEEVQRLLWTNLPNYLGLSIKGSFLPILVCGIGGVVLGLLLKKLGSYPPTIEQALANFKTTKKFDYKHIGEAFIISVVSLGFGASLGPEAALTTIVCGFATLISIKLKKKALLRFGSEIDKKLPKYKRNILGIIAGVSGLLVFRLYGSSGYFNLHLNPYTFKFQDVLLSLIPAFVGIFFGYIYLYSERGLDKIFKSYRKNNIVFSVIIGGLGLGILASMQPLAIFSGHEGLNSIVAGYSSESAIYFVVLSCIKVIATTLCLATGWKGGRFFPIMFIGASAGTAASVLLPSINPTLALCVGMGAALSFVLKRPVVSLVLLMFFFPINLYLPLLVVCFMASYVSKKLTPYLAYYTK